MTVAESESRRVMKKLYLLVGPALLFCVSAGAQDTATIVGTVTDPSGAGIPGVDVTVSNPEKGFTHKLVSNAAGEYMAAKVPIGNYVLEAESSGFQKLVRSGITLSVGQTQRVDLQLTIGQISQEITVNGNVPKVETESAAVSDVVTRRPSALAVSSASRSMAGRLLAEVWPAKRATKNGLAGKEVGCVKQLSPGFRPLPVLTCPARILRCGLFLDIMLTHGIKNMPWLRLGERAPNLCWRGCWEGKIHRICPGILH